MSGRTSLPAVGMVLLIAGFASACQQSGTTAETTPTAATPTAAASTMAASPSEEEPTPTEAAVACLDPAVRDAIGQIGNGEFDTDPALAAVADALEALELEGADAEARDRLVDALRADPIDELALRLAALSIVVDHPLPAC